MSHTIRVLTLTLFLCSLFVVVLGPIPNAEAATTLTYSNTTAGFVDSGTDTRTVTVPAGDFPADNFIGDVNITVDFEKEGDSNCTNPDTNFSYAREISMSLTSPAGTTVNLVYDQTPGPASYPTFEDAPPVVVTFDDSAAAVVGTTNGGIPESGTFRPAEPLSAFIGQDPAGTWTFTFGDDAGGDYLCFNSFDLTISTEISLAVPNLGLVQINAHESVLPYGAPGMEQQSFALPADYDGNGFDTYVVAAVTTYGDEYWLGLFVGGPDWLWVPYSAVQVLTPISGID